MFGRNFVLRFAFIISAFAAIVDAQVGTKVGPAKGTVIVEGGAPTDEIYSRFIQAAGGPNALIIDVPTANVSGALTEPDTAVSRKLKSLGAKNIVLLHATDKKLAGFDSFFEPVQRARGVWFEDGRPSNLVDTYAGTKTEEAFRDVLDRGGVVGGHSAGAVILGSRLPAQPGIIAANYEQGFAFLRGVVIEPRAVASEWLQSFGNWFMSHRQNLLGLAVDEGAAWIVRGDVAEIIGRSKAFVYGGADANDAGKPFLTLYPGDQYNLATHRLIRRAANGSSLTPTFVDSVFADFMKPGSPAATVLVAQDGKVLVDKSFNIAEQPKYLPTTTSPNFPLGTIADTFNAIAAQLLAAEGKLSLDNKLSADTGVTVRQYLQDPAKYPDGSQQLRRQMARTRDVGSAPSFEQSILRMYGSPYRLFVALRLAGAAGARKVTIDAATGEFQGNVDELYRWDYALQTPSMFHDASLSDGTLTLFRKPNSKPVTAPILNVNWGWQRDIYRGTARFSIFGTEDGKRNAFVRIPGKRVCVIILTSKEDADARGMAERITDRLFGQQ